MPTELSYARDVHIFGVFLGERVGARLAIFAANDHTLLAAELRELNKLDVVEP